MSSLVKLGHCQPPGLLFQAGTVVDTCGILARLVHLIGQYLVLRPTRLRKCGLDWPRRDLDDWRECTQYVSKLASRIRSSRGVEVPLTVPPYASETVYVLSTVPTWYLVDSLGRRPILLSGATVSLGPR